MTLSILIREFLIFPLKICIILSNNKDLIIGDLLIWNRNYNHEPSKRLSYFLINHPSFRTVFFYRLKKENSLLIKILLKICLLLYKPKSYMYITTKSIGTGFFFLHDFSTIVSAKSIGNNCWVNQQVTIGYTTPDSAPVIGDDVRIYAGAKVLGDITIGNNVIIGANAVVVKHVPDNCTVVGVPAYIIKKMVLKLGKIFSVSRSILETLVYG